MKTKSLKIGILIISLVTLILNISPLFAQTLEIEVMGGGYKLQGPNEINFENVSIENIKTTSDAGRTKELSFRDIELVTVDERTIEGGLMVIDENGGNSFNVTVTVSSQLAQSVANCDTEPYNCIPISSLSIKNQDNDGATEDVNTRNGSPSDFALDSFSDNYVEFTRFTTTTAGSTGTTLNVVDSSVFGIGDQIKVYGAEPHTFTVQATPTGTTITLDTALTSEPEAGRIVERAGTPDSITIGNGSGSAPGRWRIYPNIRIIIPEGQRPGEYFTTLSFTIA